MSRTSQLRILNANQDDSGRYECRIMVGQQKESVMFDVMSEGDSGSGGGGGFDRKRIFKKNKIPFCSYAFYKIYKFLFNQKKHLWAIKLQVKI